MLQKLYHHLEQINANTRQQQANHEQTEVWAEKITQQQQANREQTEVWAARISQQLDELNTSIQALGHRRPRRVMPIAGLLLAGLALVLVGMLSMYAVQLSAETNIARDRSNASLEAYGVVNTRYQQVAGRALNLETKTAELDSLVRRQNQTITQLRRMNAAAIRTILYLQRDIYQNRPQLQTQALVR